MVWRLCGDLGQRQPLGWVQDWPWVLPAWHPELSGGPEHLLPTNVHRGSCGYGKQFDLTPRPTPSLEAVLAPSEAGLRGRSSISPFTQQPCSAARVGSWRPAGVWGALPSTWKCGWLKPRLAVMEVAPLAPGESGTWFFPSALALGPPRGHTHTHTHRTLCDTAALWGRQGGAGQGG